MEKQMSKNKIPQIDSIEDLARFWDTHDLSDFADELEEAPETVFERKRDAVLTVHLPPKEAEALKRIAEMRGIEQATLIREWVLEKIHGQ
jgi:predicted DNA binding CopG/RHH family protein